MMDCNLPKWFFVPASPMALLTRIKRERHWWRDFSFVTDLDYYE
jgi:hypothetical protein